MGAGKVRVRSKASVNSRLIKKFMIKKIIFLFFILPAFLFAQAEYVSTDNPVYDFLNRMETLQLIENYNSFEIPKNRREIGKLLNEIIRNEDQLDFSDKNFLNDLKIEFELEIYSTLNSSEKIIGDGSYDYFSQSAKYLYFHNEPERFNIFINLLSEGELIYQRNETMNINSGTPVGFYGGEIRGSIYNKFGYFLRGYQGQVFGNRQTARIKKEIEYNFKYNLALDEGYFDETSGYMSADFDILKLKFGRDRLLIGHGNLKPFSGNNGPMFDYLSLNINYKFMNFSYFHGKLLGNIISVYDSITGGVTVVDEKYIGYHRLNFNLSNNLSLAAGEIIIYGDRGIDFSYLNPFALYKSVEHSNQDRDNSMLFFDLNFKPVRAFKVFTTLLIDDISFGKIGSGWWGNQILLHAGLFSNNFYNIIPVDLSLEYLRVEPYTLTHRLPGNNFTHNGYNIGIDLHPNSELFFSQINYRFNNRLRLTTSFSLTIHGANPLNEDGSIRNVGGNINLGHREFDPETTELLDGDIEYLRKFSFLIFYEPVNQIYFSLNIVYYNNSLQNSLKFKETQMLFLIGTRI